MSDIEADIIARYADKVAPEHVMAMSAIAMFRQLLGQHRPQLEALIKAEHDMHDFGGLLDPTLYRDMLYSKSFAQQLKLVNAAIAFLDAIDEVAKEIEHDKN